MAERTAPAMFTLSLLFLVGQAIVIVAWVDVRNFVENARIALEKSGSAAQLRAVMLEPSDSESLLVDITLRAMAVIWIIVIAEAVLHWTTRPKTESMKRYHQFSFLFCLMPSLRIGARSPEMRGRIWLPTLGWRQPNDRLRKRLEKRFSIPMIAIALMIMPVLIVDLFLKAQVAQYEWLRIALHISTGVIWFAFAAEFILMVSIAEKKLIYCRNHWIDLAIILLPLVSFLRSLRLVRATRAVHLLRVQQITKLARAYRLRGTAVKALRALIMLEFVQRLLTSNTERTIERLQRQLDDLESEAKSIRRRINKLQYRLEKEEAEAQKEETGSEAEPESEAPDPAPTKLRV